MNANQVNPCPFCGNQPIINHIEPHSHSMQLGGFKMPDHPGSCVIECSCGGGMIDNDLQKVSQRWNSRALSPSDLLMIQRITWLDNKNNEMLEALRQKKQELHATLNAALDYLLSDPDSPDEIIEIISATLQVNATPAEVDVENARRVIACQNACAGIPTETLEIYYGDQGGIDAALKDACLRDQLNTIRERNEAYKTIEHLRLRIKQMESSKALADVAAERRRQVEVEGFTHENDDKYDCCELSLAAGCYAMFTSGYPEGDPVNYWIWDKKWWKPSEDKRKNLIKAAALLIAEIERIDRTTTKKVGAA
ncbi:hypothetical protein [Undibacterium curvum]|uniref:hypothetical protein n=1 Tax=Undibacterium curvum TaxID=2762294 RepID=UPI003D10C5B9